jgi:DNA-binding Xre family transcriptional regulator
MVIDLANPQWLEAALYHRRMTMPELARRSGVGLRTIQHIKRGHGQGTLGNVLRLAEALDCQVRLHAATE